MIDVYRATPDGLPIYKIVGVNTDSSERLIAGEVELNAASKAGYVVIDVRLTSGWLAYTMVKIQR